MESMPLVLLVLVGSIPVSAYQEGTKGNTCEENGLLPITNYDDCKEANGNLELEVKYGSSGGPWTGIWSTHPKDCSYQDNPGSSGGLHFNNGGSGAYQANFLPVCQGTSNKLPTNFYTTKNGPAAPGTACVPFTYENVAYNNSCTAADSLAPFLDPLTGTRLTLRNGWCATKADWTGDKNQDWGQCGGCPPGKSPFGFPPNCDADCHSSCYTCDIGHVVDQNAHQQYHCTSCDITGSTGIEQPYGIDPLKAAHACGPTSWWGHGSNPNIFPRESANRAAGFVASNGLELQLVVYGTDGDPATDNYNTLQSNDDVFLVKCRISKVVKCNKAVTPTICTTTKKGTCIEVNDGCTNNGGSPQIVGSWNCDAATTHTDCTTALNKSPYTHKSQWCEAAISVT